MRIKRPDLLPWIWACLPMRLLLDRTRLFYQRPDAAEAEHKVGQLQDIMQIESLPFMIALGFLRCL
jgi:hypothetical protein